jgi:tripartite-type tricarboxylate transporter receptor subunit TctC
MKGNRPSFAAVWLCLTMMLVSGDVTAQSESYPSKSVRIVVDSAPGSANDATSRILADKLSQIWGQPVLTLNQPGAGGGIAARVASQSPNDGYTLYLPSTSTFLALPGGPGVAPNMPVELPRDFASIGFVLQQPLFIGASHKSGITSLPQLTEMAKQRPNEITYAATGRGRLTHLTMELFQARTGVKLQLVPYAGGPAQAMNDVMSGRVHLVLDAYAGLAAALQGNLIKGLANTSLERLPGFENLPTVAETIPGFFVGRHYPQGERRSAHRSGRPGRQKQVRGQWRVCASHDPGTGYGIRPIRAEDLAADFGTGESRDREVIQA